jgi:dynamin 1-like protein
VKGSLLIPEEPFELLAKRSLARLEGPALQAYEFVFEELLRMAEQCIPRDFARFPILEVATIPVPPLPECSYTADWRVDIPSHGHQ